MTELKSDLFTAAGAALLICAAFLGEMSWLAARDIAGLGAICGSAGRLDCPYLVASALLLVTGGGALAVGLRQRPKLARRRLAR